MKCRELQFGDWCRSGHGLPMQITNVGDDYAYATFEGNECDPWEFDDKQSSELVGKAKDLLASNHGALIMLRTIAGLLGGEAAIDQMMESVVDLFCVEGKEERQRLKGLISGYTVMPIKKEE